MDPLAIVMGSGVVIQGHFQYASGLHGDTYVGKITDPALIKSLSWYLAAFSSNDTQVVVAPESGGIPYATGVAAHLSVILGRPVQPAVARKRNSGFFLEDPKTVQRKEVLIVDDALTTGGSLKQVVRAVRQAGGIVLGAMVIWNRGGITFRDLNVPFLHPLITKQLPSYPAGNACPGCVQNLPLIVT